MPLLACPAVLTGNRRKNTAGQAQMKKTNYSLCYRKSPQKHCWASQQWHPEIATLAFFNGINRVRMSNAKTVALNLPIETTDLSNRSSDFSIVTQTRINHNFPHSFDVPDRNHIARPRSGRAAL